MKRHQSVLLKIGWWRYYASQAYLAGVGIRGMINPGIDPRTGQPRTIWQGIQNGLLEGIANIGINYATQELGLNPLLANIGFSAISTAINAGLQVALGAINKNLA